MNAIDRFHFYLADMKAIYQEKYGTIMNKRGKNTLYMLSSVEHQHESRGGHRSSNIERLAHEHQK